MKLASALVSIGAMACGVWASAHAQDPGRTDCERFDRIVAAAPEHFRSLRGQEIQPATYLSTLTFPGYPRCTIVDRADSGFLCYQPAPPGVARFLYQAELSKLRQCAAGWATLDIETPPDEHLEVVDSVSFVHRTANGEVVAGVLLGRSKSSSQPELHLLGRGFIFRPTAPVS